MSFPPQLSPMAWIHLLLAATCRLPVPNHPIAAASIVVATILLAGNAMATGTLPGGYVIHREASVPPARKAAQAVLPGLRAACEREGAAFRFGGDLDKVGTYQVIEHHHPGMRKSSVVKRHHELVAISRCHYEVRVRETTRISHYGPRQRTVLSREIDPVRGPQPWRRRAMPHLEHDTAALLRDALSLDSLAPAVPTTGEAALKPAAGQREDRIAGRSCRWVQSPPPVEVRSCVLPEGIGMPIDDSLSTEVFSTGSDGTERVLEVRVVRFEGPFDLPANVFEPQEDAGDAAQTR